MKRNGTKEAVRIHSSHPVLIFQQLNLFGIHSSQALALAEPLFFLLIDLLNPSLQEGLKIPEDFLESLLQTNVDKSDKTYQHAWNLRYLQAITSKLGTVFIQVYPSKQMTAKREDSHGFTSSVFGPFGEALKNKAIFGQKKLIRLKP